MRRPDGQVVQQLKSSQSNQPTPNPDHDRTVQPVVGTDPGIASGGRKTSRSQEIETRSFHEEAVKHDRTGQPVVETGAPQTRSSDDSKSFNVEDKTAHDRTGQPVVGCHTNNMPDGSQTRSSHESTSFHVGDETMHDRTGQPVVNRDESGHEELVKNIENHPDRHALQLDLQQNKAYNPFSATSKKMIIKDVGNVELFELFETDPQTQCKACLSYWSEGIVYCTCGHLLKEIVANRGFIVYILDLLSIPEYVLKKERLHGHRHGKAPENKEYHLAHNLKKRFIKRDFTGIHDRFLRDHVFRERLLENNRDEDVCRKWDDLADQDHTYRMSESECKNLGYRLSGRSQRQEHH